MKDVEKAGKMSGRNRPNLVIKNQGNMQMQ